MSQIHKIFETFCPKSNGKMKLLDFYSSLFSWIRAHDGIIGNEIADRLAKGGAVAHTRIAYDLISVSFIKRLTK